MQHKLSKHCELKLIYRKSSSAGSGGRGSSGVTEAEEELRKVAVAVDDFQKAVAEVSQFQRNVLSVIKASAKYGLPGYQGRDLDTQSKLSQNSRPMLQNSAYFEKLKPAKNLYRNGHSRGNISGT